MKNDQIFISYVHNKSNEMSETIGWNEKETRRKMEINSQVRLRKKPHTKDHKWWEFLFKWYKSEITKKYMIRGRRKIYIYITASLSWRNEKKNLRNKIQNPRIEFGRSKNYGVGRYFMFCMLQVKSCNDLLDINSIKWVYPFDLNYGCWEVLLLNIITR